MRLKHQLKFYMTQQGITAAELARRCGVSKQTLSLWLGGSEPRKLSQVKCVADYLKTSVDNLCFGSGVELEKDDADLDRLLGNSWVGGFFEVRLRRIKKP